jgi:hypothetical protein
MSSRTEFPQPMLLGEYSGVRLLGLAWSVYIKNYSAIAFTFAAIFLPIALLTILIRQVSPLGSVAIALLFAFGYFASFGPLTFTISDICLGNIPTLRRSYSAYFRGGLWLRTLWTLVLLYIYGMLFVLIVSFFAVIIGFLTAYITQSEPLSVSISIVLFLAAYAFLFYLIFRVQFAQSIVVIEKRWANDAMRRSLALSRHNFWRIFAVALLSFVVLAIAQAVIYTLAIGIGRATGLSSDFGSDFFAASLGDSAPALGAASPPSPFVTAVMGIAQLAIVPVTVILNVLLYYDLRVRQESYDVRALYEDMMR